jgi:hypothetical protein
MKKLLFTVPFLIWFAVYGYSVNDTWNGIVDTAKLGFWVTIHPSELKEAQENLKNPAYTIHEVLYQAEGCHTWTFDKIKHLEG